MLNQLNKKYNFLKIEYEMVKNTDRNNFNGSLVVYNIKQKNKQLTTQNNQYKSDNATIKSKLKMLQLYIKNKK